MIAKHGRAAAAAEAPFATRFLAADGFSLIEALASVAVFAAILGALGAVTGQWIPAWSRGLAQTQRADLLSLGLERIAADVEAAVYVSRQGASTTPFFVGEPSSVTFVRGAYGPSARNQLEIVRIAERRDAAGVSIVREQAPFAPSGASGGQEASIALKDAVVLVREPFHVTFAYAGADRNWTANWREADKLPSAMRLTVRDATTDRILAATTAFTLHVTAPPPQAPPDANTDPQSNGRTANR